MSGGRPVTTGKTHNKKSLAYSSGNRKSVVSSSKPQGNQNQSIDNFFKRKVLPATVKATSSEPPSKKKGTSIVLTYALHKLKMVIIFIYLLRRLDSSVYCLSPHMLKRIRHRRGPWLLG